MKLIRFTPALAVLNALFFYGIGDIGLTRPEYIIGILIVNFFLSLIAFMLTIIYPKNQ